MKQIPLPGVPREVPDAPRLAPRAQPPTPGNDAKGDTPLWPLKRSILICKVMLKSWHFFRLSDDLAISAARDGKKIEFPTILRNPFRFSRSQKQEIPVHGVGDKYNKIGHEKEIVGYSKKVAKRLAENGKSSDIRKKWQTGGASL